ncbi:ABC transporter ATP-binding protein [Chloroflexota bacterium]
MAEVRFENVTKQFGDVVAVNNLNLEIPDKEFLVLVGPSGCGKSTALRLLSGLEEITAGNIFIGDRLVNNIPSKDRDVAMVFQSYALYPHMSVYNNMAFGLSLRKIPKTEIEPRVQEAARILGIENLLRRKPRQLSGGQRQRVALGRAIVREPAVFLLDEPLSNLDAKLRVQTRAELSKLHQRLGTTFLYVTHDQVEAMTMASRIAVIDEGILQQVGKPQELYEHPANMFVAGFIGSPAMNFFKMEVKKEQGVLSLETGGLRVAIPHQKTKALTPYMGKKIIFGIRPENIHDKDYPPSGYSPDDASSPTSLVQAKVDVTEMMGNEVFLHLLSEENSFLARVDARTMARPGQDITLIFNMSDMHAFDPASSKAVLI